MDGKNQREGLRIVLIAVFFVAGLIFTFIGWRMTGKLAGLGLIVVGMVLLLTTLFLYNKPYGGNSR